MTTISIGTQISGYDIIGEEGCILFWLSSVIQPHVLVIGGFGMAVFRLICVENAAQQITKEMLLTIIHAAELILLCCTVTLVTSGMISTGFEQAGMYQFCRDFGKTKAETYQSYNSLSSQEFGKKIRLIYIYSQNGRFAPIFLMPWINSKNASTS